MAVWKRVFSTPEPMLKRTDGVVARLSEYAGQPNAFNAFRLIAAIAVLVSHAFPLTGSAEPLYAATGQTTVGTLAVSAFFVISGFLIPASFNRSTIAQFAEKRARRILPGLIAAVLVCILVVGPLATTLPVGRFLGDGGTWRFLGQAVFLPTSQSMPGVFDKHPLDAVNGSLWSLRFEVACYVFVAAAMIIPRLRFWVTISAWLASFIICRIFSANAGGASFYLGTIAELFRFFGAGMLLYLFSAYVPVSRGLLGLGMAITVAAAFSPVFMDVTAITGSYALIAGAYLAGPRLASVASRNDISYGIYVYAFPIQQLFVPPALGTSLPWLTNAALALPVTVFAGWVSWLCVERPLMHRRPRAG